MPYTPPSIIDDVTTGDAAFWLSSFEDIHDQAVANAGSAPWINAQTDFGIAPGNSGDANQTELDALVAQLNSTGGNVLFPASAPCAFAGPANPITHGQVYIFGEGRGATHLQVETGGHLFKFGNATGAGTNQVGLRDMTLEVLTGAPPASDSLVYLTNVDWFNIENIHVKDVPGFIRLGTDASDASRTQIGVVRGITGSYADVGGHVLWCRQTAGVNFYDIEMHGPTGGTDQGTPIHVDAYDPTVGSASGCEALRFHNVAVWSAWKTPDSGGQPKGIFIDYTNGSVLNCWFTNGESDWNSTAGAQIFASSGSHECRNVNFHGWYLNNGGHGHGLLINPDSGKVRDVSVDRCRMPLFDKPAIKVAGAGDVADVFYNGNKFMDKDSATVKTCVIESNKGHFQATGNKLRHITDAAVNVDYFVWVRSADAVGFDISHNKAAALNVGFVNHNGTTGYTSASLNRVVKDNLDPTSGFSIASASTIVLPDHGEMFNITGTTAIANIRPAWNPTGTAPMGAGLYGRRVTLKFTGTVTVNETGNLRLEGNFGATADDTLTLVCDGAVWYEQTRSNNS